MTRSPGEMIKIRDLPYAFDPNDYTVLRNRNWYGQPPKTPEDVGLHECRSEEGMEQMRMVLGLPHLPINPKRFEAGSYFVPGSCMWFKQRTSTLCVGCVVPDVRRAPNTAVKIYPDPSIHLDICYYSLVVSQQGIFYTCVNFVDLQNRKDWQDNMVPYNFMMEIRIDTPIWAYAHEVKALQEEGKTLPSGG